MNIVLLLSSALLAIVSMAVYVFFIMVDNDEKAHYSELGKEVPFEDIRGDGCIEVVFAISAGVILLIMHITRIKSKLILLGCGVIYIVVCFISNYVFDILYYKIKNKRYPHLNPDTKDEEKEIDSGNNNNNE